MRLYTLLLCLGLLTLAALPISAQSSAPAPAAPLKAALIADPTLGLADSAAFNLLAVELSKSPDLALLERAEVDQLLKERTLQLALSAEGVAERRALGTLLQARLLVVLRAGETKVGGKTVRYADLVACETAQGLRLVRDRIPWNDSDPQAFATAAAASAALARRCLAEPARAILAVPPFVSGDLERRHDAMQDACALLVGESLAATPGLRLVELAEARAIAEEMKIGAATAIGRELLPCYLTGGYRNEGAGAARKVTLTLELRQGERPLGQRKSGLLAPEALADYLKSQSRELLGQALALPAAAFDPAAERAELTRLARQFLSLGEWEPALNLTEAALLLAPGDLPLRKLALDLSTQVINNAASDADSIKHAIAVNLRALDHYEAYLRLRSGNTPTGDYRELLKQRDEMDAFWQAGITQYWSAEHRTALKPLLAPLGRAKREIVIERIEKEQKYSGTSYLYDGRDPLNVYVAIEEPAAERYQAYLRVFRAWQRQSNGQSVEYGQLLKRLRPDKDEDKPAYLDLLARIAEMPGRQHAFLVQYARLGLESLKPQERRTRLRELSARVEAARLDSAPEHDLLAVLEKDTSEIDEAAEREKDIARYKKEDAERAKRPAETPRPMPTPPPGADFTIAPLTGLKIEPLGWIEAGGATDLIWDKVALYAMRRPGELTQVLTLKPPPPVVPPGWTSYLANEQWELYNPKTNQVQLISDRPTEAFTEVVFDGRWAWAPLTDRLLVVDIDRVTSVSIGAAQGLPPGKMCVAPLGPGRVCVAGGFGRGWCAVVEFDGVHAKVGVFHEARLATGDWTDPALAFTPRFAATLRGADGRPRVLVGREMKGRGRFLPLLLDPERRTVQTVPQRFSWRLSPVNIASIDGELCWIANSFDLADMKMSDSYADQNRPRLFFERFGASDDHPRSLLFSDGPFGTTPGFGNPLACFQDGLFLGVVFNGKDSEFSAADPERGRVIRLKGTVPPDLFQVSRLGRSHHYGMVLMASIIRPPFHALGQLTLAPGLRERLAAVTPENPGGHTIAHADPLEGRYAVLRHYLLMSQEHYTTFTAPIKSQAFVVEKEHNKPRVMLMLYAADQRDPLLKKEIWSEGADRVQIIPRSARSFETSDDPFYLPLPIPPGGKIAPPPRCEVAIADAAGKPIAGAEVIIVRHTRPATGNILASDAMLTSRTFGPLHTDAAGKVAIDAPTMPDASFAEVTLTHPDYGWAEQSVSLIVSSSMIPISSRMMNRNPAFGVRETNWVALPLVRRGSPEEATAVRGRIVDESGRPLAGARVLARIDFRLGGIVPTAPDLRFYPGGGLIYSDDQGRFAYCPVTLRYGAAPMKKAATPVAGLRKSLVVWIDFPGRPELSPVAVALLPGVEQMISVKQEARHCPIRILDRNAKSLDASMLKLKLFRYDPVAEYGAMPGRRTAPNAEKPLYDCDSGKPFPKALDLLPGAYRVVSGATGGSATAVLLPDSPAQLVFYFTSLSAGEPGLKEAVGATSGSVPANYVRAFTGRIIDGLTSRPLAGACVVTNISENPSIFYFSPESWQMLRGLPASVNLSGDPRLSVFKSALLYRAGNQPRPFFAAQTQADGRFSMLERNEYDIDSLTCLAQGYIGRYISHFEPPVNKLITLPKVALYPAARLRLNVKADLPPSLNSIRIKLDYAFADPRRGAWDQVFPTVQMSWGRTTDHLLYDDEIYSNRSVEILVPAGARFKLTLTPPNRTYQLEQWRAVTFDREIELKPGETLDLGEIVMPRTK